MHISIFYCALKSGLLVHIQFTIVVHVKLEGDAIQAGNTMDYDTRVRGLDSLWQCLMRRCLDHTIKHRLSQGTSFDSIKLAVIVRIERCHLGECFSDMRYGGSTGRPHV